MTEYDKNILKQMYFNTLFHFKRIFFTNYIFSIQLLKKIMKNPYKISYEQNQTIKKLFLLYRLPILIFISFILI